LGRRRPSAHPQLGGISASGGVPRCSRHLARGQLAASARDAAAGAASRCR
jgi:hypothetical protein